MPMARSLCDRLGRVFGRIGLKRVPKDATTLQQYVARPVKPSADIDEEAIGADAD